MWLAPFCPEKDHYLSVHLDSPTALQGFRVWNYNKSGDDSYRGAIIRLNQKLHLTAGVLLAGVGFVRVLLDGQDVIGHPISVSHFHCLAIGRCMP